MFNRTRAISIALTCTVMFLCQSAWGQVRSSSLNPSRSSFASGPDGVLEPWKISDVACAESGIIEQILVKAGQRVQAGELLATLKSKAISIQLEIAQAQALANGKVQSVQADVELNEKKVRAFQDARHNEFSSQLELERAESEFKVAQGRLTAELEEKRILELQVSKLQHQLSQHSVVAPLSGIVFDLHKQVGEYVAPSSPEVLRIVDISKLRASFFLRLDEIERLLGEEHVDVELSDGRVVSSEIEHISPIADSESGLVEIRVLIDNPENKILGSRCTLLLDPPNA